MAFYRNTAGQKIGAQLASATDGSPYTTGPVSAFITLDAGTQTAGTGGTCVHGGEGYWTYSPSQAETDGILCAYTFIGSGAVPQTTQTFTPAIPTLTPTQGLPGACALAGLLQPDVHIGPRRALRMACSIHDEHTVSVVC